MGAIKPGYTKLLQEIKSRIRAAQYEALQAVNKELIALYWDLGKMIAENQEIHGWGKSVVENLASDIQREFPGVSGYSRDNLWRMRKFYLRFKADPKLAPLVQEISWSKIVIILESSKDPMEQEFYLRMTRRMGWTKSILIHQIENETYQKTLANQTSFAKTLPAPIKHQAKLAVKDEYTFDFLELGEDHAEVELERALILRINRFLIEMGGAFAFMGNQFRLEIEGREYFIDILLYHRRLRCMVAVELKVGEFMPEHVGKMQFYLAALDDLVKEKEDRASIGIILCKDKNKTIVEYALRETKKPIGVAKYKIMKKVPAKLKKELPAPAQIKSLLKEV